MTYNLIQNAFEPEKKLTKLSVLNWDFNRNFIHSFMRLWIFSCLQSCLCTWFSCWQLDIVINTKVQTSSSLPLAVIIGKNFNLMSAELLQKHFCCPRNESVVIKISWHTSNTVQQPKECKHNKILHKLKMNIAHHQRIFGQLIEFKGYSFITQWKKLTSVALQTQSSTSDLQLFYKMSKDVLLES